jgi:hypothetical protein
VCESIWRSVCESVLGSVCEFVYGTWVGVVLCECTDEIQALSDAFKSDAYRGERVCLCHL